MEGFGVHTSMWTMSWDQQGCERAVAKACSYHMDFLEIALHQREIRSEITLHFSPNGGQISESFLYLRIFGKILKETFTNLTTIRRKMQGD